MGGQYRDPLYYRFTYIEATISALFDILGIDITILIMLQTVLPRPCCSYNCTEFKLNLVL